MIYISLTLLSGIILWILSIYFRSLELKKKIILMPKQLISQIALFFVFGLIFQDYFSEVVINLGFLELNWVLIYILFSSVSYYAVQVFYEYFTWNKLFATEKEIQEYIDKLQQDNNMS
jgi:hypothetical protein